MSLSKNEIKFIKSLQQKKFRDSEGLFVVEGEKMVHEAIHQKQYPFKNIYCLEDFLSEIPKELEPIAVTQAELERISGLKSANKTLAVLQKVEASAIDRSEDNLILILDHVNDPGNLGTILRTADWFGITQIVCSENTVELFNPKVVQASMGAVFRVNVLYTNIEDALDQLKTADFELIGAEIQGESAVEKNFAKKTALVMGSESHGLSPEIQAKVNAVTIPKFGKTESLNVAMACGILLAQYKS